MRSSTLHISFLIDFRAGNFHDSLSDAKTALDLQPSYVGATVIGERHRRKW